MMMLLIRCDNKQSLCLPFRRLSRRSTLTSRCYNAPGAALFVTRDSAESENEEKLIPRNFRAVQLKADSLIFLSQRETGISR